MKGHEYRDKMLEIGIKIMPFVDYKRVKRCLNKYRNLYHSTYSLKQTMDIIAQSSSEIKKFQRFLDERYQKDTIVYDSDFRGIMSRVSYLNYEQTCDLLNKVITHKANHLFLLNNGRREDLWYA